MDDLTESPPTQTGGWGPPAGWEEAERRRRWEATSPEWARTVYLSMSSAADAWWTASERPLLGEFLNVATVCWRDAERTQRELPDRLPGEDRHVVYRLWAPDSQLLYVGVSSNLRSRVREHRKRFGARLGAVSYFEYPSRVEAEAAELEAIRTERPVANVRR